ncbi:MAG: hypothetical protein ACPG80_01130 [Rickettsiales bacterium]
MTDTPYDAMAKQFVQMWQQQIAQMMNNPQFVQSMIDQMHQWPNFQGAPHANPANATVSPEFANDAVGDLAKRLAASEARIAELERELAALRRVLADDGSADA